MKENKLIIFLIPVIAIIVVFESIMLVSNLEKSPKNEVVVETKKGENEVVIKENIEESVAEFVWETENLEMKVGKTYNITLNLLSKQNLVLDSIETYTYFDPKLVEVSKLVTNKEGIGQELKSKIDNEKGLVSSILWSGDKAGVGYETNKGESVEVLSFMITPKAEGNLEFNLSTRTIDEKSASIIVETNTSKSLVYSSNKLEINVIK